MEKAGITMGKFIAGIVIAILVSSAVSVGISTLLIKGSPGPQGEKGETGATGATGPQGPYLPDYDSGWVDITNKSGKYFNVTHNLNTEDVIVDIRGKTTASDGANQRYHGLTGNIPGWTKTYGGANIDSANSLVETDDGGYAIAGLTYSFGASQANVFLVRTDASGNQLWQKLFGGGFSDVGYSLVQTGDGGYAIAGWTGSFGVGNNDVYLVKTYANGSFMWQQAFGGTEDDYGFSLVETDDGGYAIAGCTNSFGAGSYDFWLIKTDSDGNQQWNKTYGRIPDDRAYSLVQTSDGGYALAGYGYNYVTDSDDFWLVKTDSAGNQEWNKTYGRGTEWDRCYSLVQTSDGGYALAGEMEPYGPYDSDFLLVKTDSAGNQQWNRTYGGIFHDTANSLVQTGDGGYALAGYTNSYGAGGYDFLLVKTDSAGNQLWNKTYGGASDDLASSVVQTLDGGYALAGSTNSYGAGNADFWLVKTNVESGLAWTDSTANTITLYRGATDIQWNYVQVRIWKID